MDLLAFLGVSIVVIVSPGQDTALTIRNTLVGGRRGGVLTALGVSSGQAVWTLAAAVGVAALIVASEPAFVALKPREPPTWCCWACARSGMQCGLGSRQDRG